MQDLVGQVMGVTGQPTRQGGTLYSVQFSDGNAYTTFDGTLAGRAQQLVNQQVSARIEMKPKKDGSGHWLNLIDIAPSGQLAPSAVPTVPGTQIQAGTPITTPAIPQLAPAVNIPMQPPRESEDVKVKRITFLSAAGTAAVLVGNVYAGTGADGIEEAEEKFKALTERLFLGSGLGGEAQAAPVTPEQVAAAVPGVEVGAPDGAEAPEPAGSGLPDW